MSESNRPSGIRKQGSGVPLPLGGHKPGEGGTAAVFTCPVCGSRFVRTMAGQQKCTACLEKELQARENDQ